MNPSLNIPHPVNFSQQQILFEDFQKAQLLHRTIGTTYAAVAQSAVKENHLTPPAHTSVVALREEARVIVAQAFLDIKKALGPLFDFAQQQLRIELDNEDTTRFDLLEILANYIPGMALKPFIEADHLNIRASQEIWNILTTLTIVSNKIWHEIESARAAYYLAHYQALLRLMNENNVDNMYRLIMFDEYGILALHNQQTYLPDL